MPFVLLLSPSIFILFAWALQIRQLVQMCQINYERELNGEKPLEMPLNRLFLGNPGTGKTTTAVLYGKILKGLGILSDGAVELKNPVDLMG